jgi:hypothetical protein
VEELVARLLKRWRAAGVKPELGATASDLAAFESCHRVRLPSDLRLFLSVANGIGFYELDGLARLRPVGEYVRILDRVPEPLVRSGDSPNSEPYFCFGDYNIEGSLWGIRLSNDPAAITPVRVFWPYSGGGQQVAGSFREFLARYLAEGPESMC